ncbi:MAG: hypothetical protein ACHRHE_16105 [Tepidisphaerales bacterium]
MKAERRHELQTNSLALWMQIRLPEIWQKYGNHILLGLIILIGAFWFVRWRIEQPKKAAAEAGMILGVVDQTLSQFRNLERLPGDAATEVPQRIADALAASDNKDIQALGFALLGEYHLAVASQPQELTSRPSKSSPDELYKLAEEAFANSLKAGSQQLDLIVRARTGRALVAEQQAFELARQENFKGDPAKNPFWQTAKEQYEAIVNDPNMIAALRDDAKKKLELLDKMQQPVWIAKAAPASMPAGPLGPEMPDSRPATPTTRPATRP